MSTQKPAVVIDGLTLRWPDGAIALDGLDAALNPGRTGLVGTNGAGKTTLLRVVAGDLARTSGSVSARGQVRYLPQQITVQTDATVADLLGVRERLDALRAIESGDADPRRFEALADDWGVEERARAALGINGLSDLDLDRRVATLSGGETVATTMTGISLSGAEIALLDEPTNDLDREARHRLYDLIASWRGTLLVASHDLELLDLMDETADLREGSLTVYGGRYSAFQEHVEREQAAAEQALTTAEQRLRTEKQVRPRAVDQEPYATALTTRIGYLPQRLDHLDDDLTILETVRRTRPEAEPEKARATLAGFGFRGDVVHRRVGDVSGGERFRVALAAVLLADPPNQLLVLDEPTNNLDIATVEQVLAALDAYRGALIVVSHDDAFLARLDIDTYVHIENGRFSRPRRLR
ncbi:ATP-binding cassette domain-containing protein [Nocardioides sp. NPDC006273]|uniref:ATP-binding cassette domain-containing protein n=1 Tax=Nocardioides sp. NPDC006273 TaxID=3155598 RepID=UPI0033B09454